MNLHRFETELTRLINKLNIDNDLSTPDFILARMVTGWLDTYAKAKDASRAWHEDEEKLVNEKGNDTDKQVVCQLPKSEANIKRAFEAAVEKCVASAGRCTTKTPYGFQCVKAAGHEDDHKFEPAIAQNLPWDQCPYVFPDGVRCVHGARHLGDHVKPVGL